MRLSQIVNDWLIGLDISGLYPFAEADMKIRGYNHWYSTVKTPHGLDHWILTVRDDHVEVREANDSGPTVVPWTIIEAADPQFFEKLERAIKAALEYLGRN